ncbi:MAG: ABC transporter substrate-binding protein [Pseudomonadota bacterium]
MSVQNGTVSPGLAETWTVSDDARHWRFRLRGGLRFHDGTACTAESVARSLERMARPDKGYTLGAPGVWHQYMADAEITCEDDLTLNVRLTAPLADFPEILAQGFIAAPSMIVALDGGGTALPCGTGPYRVLRADPDLVVAERVDGHFRAGSGPKDVRWMREPTAEGRRDLLVSGRAQVAIGVPSPGLDPVSGITWLRYVNPVAIIYLLNSAQGPLSDPRLRKALDLAVDRRAVVQNVLGGHAVPLHAIMPPFSQGADRPAPVAQDLPAARRLMAEAGYADGLTLRLDCPTRLPDEAEALTAELARQIRPLGITLDVTMHRDREAYAHMVRRKEIGDLCVFDSSPQSTFRVLYEKIDSRVRGSWWQGYANPGVESDLDLARRTTDAEGRTAIYRGIIAGLQDDPPWLTLYTPMKVVGLAGRHEAFRMPPDAVLDICAVPDF